MMMVLKHYPKKGSVIFVVIAIFVALMILLASFVKSTSSRVHSTKKICDTMHARELANSLAVLINHYIKHVELKKAGSELKKLLSLPIDKMKDGEGKISREELVKYFGSLYTSLIDSSGLNKLEIIDLSWKIYKDDFSSLQLDGKDSPYPREKKGMICSDMKISYLLPGTKKPITEEYSFSSDIKIVANLLPVLSKFSFYVEDVFDKRNIGDELVLTSYFNVVDTTEGGILNSGSPRPWVINNGGGSNFDNYKDYLTDKRGFIYLGGGTNDRPIILGIARGFSSATQGDFGEDFHFYKNGRQGYWKLREVWTKSQPVANILEAEIGLCNDNTASFNNWQKKFGNGRYDKISRYNSIFRLYGTDSLGKSPTLVYGYVDSMHGSVRAFKNSGGHNYLYFFDYEEDFINSAGYGDSSLKIYDLYAFGGAYVGEFGGEQATYEDYNDKYTSKITRSRYNRDFTYFLAKEKGKSPSDQQYPLKYCTDLLKGELKNLCSDDEDDIFLNVPNADGAAEFRNIYSSSINLEKLDEFIDPEKLCIDGSSDDEEKKTRIAYNTAIKSSEDAEEFLKINGLLRNKDLDLNGWVYFDCGNNDLVLNDLKVITQGGIIAKGNITIKGNIKSDSGAHLNIIALNGNITIERGVENIDASLIAEKTIKLEGDEKDKKLYINGNIVMGSILSKNGKNVDTDKMKRGFFLKYNTDLSAIPFSNKYNVEEEKTEIPLLMFNIKENIKMLD